MTISPVGEKKKKKKKKLGEGDGDVSREGFSMKYVIQGSFPEERSQGREGTGHEDTEEQSPTEEAAHRKNQRLEPDWCVERTARRSACVEKQQEGGNCDQRDKKVMGTE